MSTLPKFDRPPVVETVIGLQFKGLQKFSTGHAGLFSKQELGDEWFTLIDGHPLDVRYEEFGDDALWQRAEIEVRPAPKSGRLQIVHCADDRMIQVQNSRFLLNWRKRDNRYPTFEILYPQFQQVFAQFDRFIEAAQLGPINPDQWEITYVNHIPIGTLWKTIHDWPNVITKILGPAQASQGELETFSANWKLALQKERGRLHVVVQHVRVGESGEMEAIDLRLTARGPISQERGWDYNSGLALGHETIVTTFANITTQTAHDFWGRTA